MGIEIVHLDALGVDAIRERILAVYGAAFAVPPYRRGAGDVVQFAGVLPRHAERAGYRCVVAREDATGDVVGFAYGHTSAPGQWWHDIVAAALEPDRAAEWLSDCFELVELAVRPAMQGRGIGGRLHDALLGGLRHRTAALSALEEATPAMHLYRGRGWVTLARGLAFPGGGDQYIIMGRRLRD